MTDSRSSAPQVSHLAVAGQSLHLAHWPVDAPRATLALVHGMGEHGGRYADSVIPHFNRLGYSVYAIDQFGHGLSSGRRGVCPSYDALMEMISALVGVASASLPCVLYGHSMGGNLVLNHALRNPNSGVDAVIATSPWLRLSVSPPRWKAVLSRCLATLAPSLALPSGLDSSLISSDPVQVERYLADPLVHDRISASYFATVAQAGEWALAHAAQLIRPTLLLHGEADQITDCNASRQFANASDQARLVTFPGMAHELHHDRKRAELLVAIDAFFGQQTLPVMPIDR
ncbi:lysophospholipase [Gammaproteobacteria bacterium]|nr:lysophospholipase [Gammaproteobacteria bacterium]